MNRITVTETDRLVSRISAVLGCEVVAADGLVSTNMLIADNPTISLGLMGSGHKGDHWPLSMQISAGPDGQVFLADCLREFQSIPEAVRAMETMGSILRKVVATVR